MQRSMMESPIGFLLPGRVLKLVLHVKQPHSNRRRKQRNREMYEQEQFYTHKPGDSHNQSGDPDIGRHDAKPRSQPAAHHADWKAVAQEEQMSRSKSEHNQGVPIQPIENLL